MRGRLLTARRLVALASLLSATAQAAPTLEALEARRDGVRLERQRWERLIATQADLAQHPDKQAAAATAAAEELRSEGRALTVEGITMGLSGTLEAAAATMDKKNWRTIKQLSDAAASVEAVQKVFIDDLTRGEHSPQKADALLEKVSATLKVAARDAPDKETREELDALLALGTGGAKLAGALLRGEKPTSAETLELAKDLTAGTRAMVLAFIQHRDPKSWVGVGRAVAKQFPKLGVVAEAVATRAILWVNLANATASACVGGYAWHEGMQLAELADDLRDQQQHAAEMLRALLPHAQKARDSAARRETRLNRMIDAMRAGTPPPAPPRAVPPSPRVLDDGIGVPPKLYFGLKATLTVLQSSPPVTYQLTKNEIRRREEIARAEREAAEARARAAERSAERERSEASSGGGSGGGGSSSSGGSYQRHDSNLDTDRIQRTINHIVTNVVTHW
jgi:uncharacterized membrane protein YgcG